MPLYLRGKTGVVEAVIEPTAVDNEEEAYGRNAGSRRHYYRIALPMTEIWPDYVGSARLGSARRGTGCTSRCSRPGWRDWHHDRP